MYITEKEMYYFEYIMEHKKNVATAYNLLVNSHYYATFNNYGYVSQEEMDELKKRVFLHDLSKFDSLEFSAYRRKLYRNDGEEVNEKFADIEFGLAWEHHYKNNDHHPEGHSGPMSQVDVLEMCLDWTAMSIKFGGSPKEYYENKKEKLIKEFGYIIDHERVSQIISALDYELGLYNGKCEGYSIFDVTKGMYWSELR